MENICFCFLFFFFENLKQLGRGGEVEGKELLGGVNRR